jgi:hypothetical protein
MAYKTYTKNEFIKKFSKSKKHFDVYKKYDYENREYSYEVRSIKNKIHENHETIDEILNEYSER